MSKRKTRVATLAEDLRSGAKRAAEERDYESARAFFVGWLQGSVASFVGAVCGGDARSEVEQAFADADRILREAVVARSKE